MKMRSVAAAAAILAGFLFSFIATGAQAAGGSSSDGKKPEYLDLGEMVITSVGTGSRIPSFILINVSIELDAGGDVGRLKAMKPAAKDAALSALYDLAYRGAFDASPVDFDGAKARVKEAVTHSLGGGVKEVLFEKFVQQRTR